jgi:hypothetical protein
VACVHPRRHNSTLQRFFLSGNSVSDHVLKSVELELVLCQLRSAHVTAIDASNKGFDDADATRIAEALRCEHPARACVCVCVCVCACVCECVCVCVCVRLQNICTVNTYDRMNA